MVDSLSTAYVRVYCERVNSHASHHHHHDHHNHQDHHHHHDHHKPQIGFSLRPGSCHIESWSLASGWQRLTTDTVTFGPVETAIVGPPVELDLAAFLANIDNHRDHDPDRDHRSCHRAKLMAMIAELEVDAETKYDILNEIIEQAEMSLEVMEGLFEMGEDKFDIRVIATVYVSTVHRLLEEEDGEDGEVEEEDFDGMVPAAEATVEALETVGIGEVSGTQCSICLDDFVEGTELCRLGCSHAFHGECVRAWLKKSHYCPLCRFQLPTKC